MTHASRLRRAALIVLAGLLIQLGCTLLWSPLSFVLFAAAGVPLVVLGVVLYAAAVLRFLAEKKAL